MIIISEQKDKNVQIKFRDCCLKIYWYRISGPDLYGHVRVRELQACGNQLNSKSQRKCNFTQF